MFAVNGAPRTKKRAIRSAGSRCTSPGERGSRSHWANRRMSGFDTKRLSVQADAAAPDGSEVRILLQTKHGSLAQFEFPAGETSIAVAHRTVEEIWYFTGGHGELWRKLGDQEDVVLVSSGLCVTIPVGTCFQVRADGGEPLMVIGVTIPPWPADGAGC